MIVSIVTRRIGVTDRARWQSRREGAGATVALQEDRALPTACYPDGAWVRRTFEVAAEG